jgi:hypothetical protein
VLILVKLTVVKRRRRYLAEAAEASAGDTEGRATYAVTVSNNTTT